MMEFVRRCGPRGCWCSDWLGEEGAFCIRQPTL